MSRGPSPTLPQILGSRLVPRSTSPIQVGDISNQLTPSLSPSSIVPLSKQHSLPRTRVGIRLNPFHSVTSQPANMSNQYTVADVAKHKDESNGMWIIVDSGVYDITSEHSLPTSMNHDMQQPS